MRVCKAIATLVLAIAVTNSTRSIAQNGPPPTPPPPATVSSVGTIADANEPGDRLEISGQVFSPDGVTPAANVIVYAYQTDATGEYRNDPKTRVARLHGWAKTDAQGHYAFHTIKPASYPRMTIPGTCIFTSGVQGIRCNGLLNCNLPETSFLSRNRLPLLMPWVSSQMFSRCKPARTEYCIALSTYASAPPRIILRHDLSLPSCQTNQSSWKFPSAMPS